MTRSPYIDRLGRRLALALAVVAGSIVSADEPLTLDLVEVEAVRAEIDGFKTEPARDLELQVDVDEAFDAIEQELRLQRAIAESLQGNMTEAIESLGDGNDDTATMFARAMWLLKEGKIDEGVRQLEIVQSRPDAPAETEKYLAVGYFHLHQPAKSETAANRFLKRHNDDAYTHYLRGLTMLRQQQPERAAEALRDAGYDDSEVAEIQQVVMQFPVDVEQRRSTINSTLGTARQINDQRLLPEDRNYNFTFLIAGEYDSNVPLQPQFSGLGANLIDYEDYRFLMASFLDVQLLTCETFNLGMVGSTYATFQFDSNRYDIQDYMGGAYANSILMDDLIGSMRYEYHHTLVEKTRFADDHRLTPSLTWLGSRGHTTLFYEFNPIDANAPALVPAQAQSADIHRVGLTQALYTFEGNGRIYGGYQYANALADGADFDRSTNMVTGRIEQPLKWDCIADLDVRYVWDDYDNPNSLDFFDRARDDKRIEIRAGLQKNFALPVSLRLDYTFIDNDSNTENLFGVRFYDYDRHIFSTQLIFTL